MIGKGKMICLECFVVTAPRKSYEVVPELVEREASAMVPKFPLEVLM
jgi:hypothetical protein